MGIKDNYQEDISTLLIPSSQTTNPLVKFIITILIAIFYFIVFDILKIYVMLFLVLAYYNISDFPYQVSRPRYRFLLMFSIIIFTVQILSNLQGELLFHLIPAIFTLRPLVPVYSEGLYFGILLLGRFWGVITISWVFVDSTNPFDFAQSLTKLGVPYRFAYSLSLSLRFTPVLNTEIKIVQQAQQTRGLNTNGNSLKGSFNLLKYTLMPLISSTLNRIQDITLSMEGRAFGLYEKRTTLKEISIKVSDYIKLIGTVFLLMIFIILK